MLPMDKNKPMADGAASTGKPSSTKPNEKTAIPAAPPKMAGNPKADGKLDKAAHDGGAHPKK